MELLKFDHPQGQARGIGARDRGMGGTREGMILVCFGLFWGGFGLSRFVGFGLVGSILAWCLC